MKKQYLNINFIRHLNAFYALVHEHERLRANVIGLYMALFQLCSLEHFPVSLMVNRSLVLRFCKIGALPAYLQCLKRLDSFGLLTYEPLEQHFVRYVIEIASLGKNALQKQVKNVPYMWSNKDPVYGAMMTHFKEK